MNLEFYEISDEYVDYMKQFFLTTMLDNKVGSRKHSRKYVGIVLKINSINYFAPLSSPKKFDYMTDGRIRKSSFLVLRMVHKYKDGISLLGTIKLNNMLPVPDSEVKMINMDLYEDKAYKELIKNELMWIRNNLSKIYSQALLLYRLKNDDDRRKISTNKQLYSGVMPFLLAEQKFRNSQKIKGLGIKKWTPMWPRAYITLKIDLPCSWNYVRVNSIVK